MQSSTYDVFGTSLKRGPCQAWANIGLFHFITGFFPSWSPAIAQEIMQVLVGKQNSVKSSLWRKPWNTSCDFYIPNWSQWYECKSVKWDRFVTVLFPTHILQRLQGDSRCKILHAGFTLRSWRQKSVLLCASGKH